jgi:hypothetical protein
MIVNAIGEAALSNLYAPYTIPSLLLLRAVSLTQTVTARAEPDCLNLAVKRTHLCAQASSNQPEAKMSVD